MDKPKQSTPSFFKILLDESANNLPLPPVFVKKQFLKGKFSETPVLRTESGAKWRVKVEKFGEKYCFGKGWIDFVKDTKAAGGDFLVFRLTGNSTFQVSIFGPNCSEKDLSRLVAPTTLKSVCLNCSRSRESIADLKTLIKIEDDDDKGKEVEEDDDDDEEEEEDDDDDDDDEDDEGEEDDDDEAEEKWMEQSNNPRFRKVLKKSHISVMNLPAKFGSKSEIIGRQRKVNVRNQAGKEWAMKIGRVSEGRVYLTNGWSNFWKDNRLMEGDTCSFQYFHGKPSFINFELLDKVPRKRGRPPLVKSMKRGRT